MKRENESCWVCRGRFNKHPVTRQFIFLLIRDELGHEHRIHKVCEASAKDRLSRRTANLPEDLDPATGLTPKRPPAE